MCRITKMPAHGMYYLCEPRGFQNPDSLFCKGETSPLAVAAPCLQPASIPVRKARNLRVTREDVSVMGLAARKTVPHLLHSASIEELARARTYSSIFPQSSCVILPASKARGVRGIPFSFRAK